MMVDEKILEISVLIYAFRQNLGWSGYSFDSADDDLHRDRMVDYWLWLLL